MLRVGPLKLKAQLFAGSERAMGPGRADLLEAIDRCGSISAAGRDLGMSYRYTWLLVDSMNRGFEAKLVETSAGGGGGGGAVLTAAGREALAAFRGLETALERAAVESADLATLQRLIREEARPAGGEG